MSGLTRILNEKLIVEKFLLLGKVELEEQRIAEAKGSSGSKAAGHTIASLQFLSL